jgi:hypothetical protein
MNHVRALLAVKLSRKHPDSRELSEAEMRALLHEPEVPPTVPPRPFLAAWEVLACRPIRRSRTAARKTSVPA